MNIHLSQFHDSDYIATMFMRFYVIDKVLTYYTTLKIMFSKRDAIFYVVKCIITSTEFSSNELSSNDKNERVEFEVVMRYLWVHRRILWSSSIYHGYERMWSLECVQTMYEVSYSEWDDGKKYIHSQQSNLNCSKNFGSLWYHTQWTIKHFSRSIRPYTNVVEHLQRRACFAPAQVSALRFGAKIWPPRIPNLQESNANNGMIWIVKVCYNCQCYVCERMNHIAKFCKTWTALQQGRSIEQRSFNNMEEMGYEEVEKQRSQVNLSCGFICFTIKRKGKVGRWQ